MPKSYQPGSRKSVYGQNHKLSENRYAWIISEAGKFLILVGKDEGSGSDVVVYHPKPGSQPDVRINLTNLTGPELSALEELFRTAFEWAKPVVERRDREADDAWNRGDDSFSRNYRPLPTVVYRKRPEPQHSESVRLGPEGVSEGGGENGLIRRMEYEELAMSWLNLTRQIVSPKTTARRLTSLRGFAKWGWDERILDDYISPVPGRTIPHPIPEGPKGLRLMMDCAPNHQQRALIAMGGFMGLRISESLEPNDSDVRSREHAR
jgi:integrase